MKQTLAVFALSVALSLGIQQARLPAAQLKKNAPPAVTYAIRYVYFSARPKAKAGAESTDNGTPRVLKSMMSGGDIPIDGSASTFLSRLAAAEPGYSFHLLLEAGSVLKEGKKHHIEKHSPTNAPDKVSLMTDITVTPYAHSQVTVRHNGFVDFVNADNSVQRNGWDNARFIATLGKTYNMGVAGFPNGEQRTLAFMIIAEPTNRTASETQ